MDSYSDTNFDEGHETIQLGLIERTEAGQAVQSVFGDKLMIWNNIILGCPPPYHLYILNYYELCQQHSLMPLGVGQCHTCRLAEQELRP